MYKSFTVHLLSFPLRGRYSQTDIKFTLKVFKRNTRIIIFSYIII
jgi:hypothetical protein